MTEIELYTQPRTPADRWTYAEHLAPARMLPGELRGSAADVYLRIEYGAALGIPPISAVSAVHIIDGKPTASAGLISGLIRGVGHKLRVWTEDDPKYPGELRAVATLTRKEDPDFTAKVVWDCDRAIKAELLRVVNDKVVGYPSRNGKAGSWDKYRPAMLKARAVSEIGRDQCEDVLLGIRYTPEEMGAEVNEDGAVIQGVVVAEQVQSYDKQEAATAAPTAATQPPAGPAAPTTTPEAVAGRLLAAWVDLDLADLGLLWGSLGESGLNVTDEAPHPVTGELVTLKGLFGEVGREIKAGRKPPTVEDPEPAETMTSMLSEPIRPTERGPIPTDQDPWATTPVATPGGQA